MVIWPPSSRVIVPYRMPRAREVSVSTGDWLRKWTRLLGLHLRFIWQTVCQAHVLLMSTFSLYVLYAACVWPLHQSTLCSTSSVSDMRKTCQRWIERFMKSVYSFIRAFQEWDQDMRMIRLTFTVSVGHVHHVVLSSVEESEPRLAV